MTLVGFLFLDPELVSDNTTLARAESLGVNSYNRPGMCTSLLHHHDNPAIHMLRTNCDRA